MPFKLRAIGSYVYNKTIGWLISNSQPEVKTMTQERLRQIINSLKVLKQQSQVVGNLIQNVGAALTVEDAVRQIDKAKASGHKLKTADGIFTQDTINGLKHWRTGLEKTSSRLHRAVRAFIGDFKFILQNYQDLGPLFMELTPDELSNFTNIVLVLSKDPPKELIDNTGKTLKAQVIDVHFTMDQLRELHQFLLGLRHGF